MNRLTSTKKSLNTGKLRHHFTSTQGKRRLKVVSGKKIRRAECSLNGQIIDTFYGKAHRVVLPNGLTILLKENHSKPLVQIDAHIKVGSNHETPSNLGAAHLIEHMLFKGTQERELGEIDREVRRLGGKCNAQTSQHETIFQLTLPCDRLTNGLDILVDVLMNATIDRSFEQEKGVVLREMGEGESMDPRERVQLELLKLAFGENHPNGRPVIGVTETVETLTKEDLLGFYHTHYVANNTVLVLTGDFKVEEVAKQIEARFSQFRSGNLPEPPTIPKPAQKTLRVKVIGAEVEETHVGFAFHIPDIQHRDTLAWSLMGTLHGGEPAGRLGVKLEHTAGLVSEISAGAYHLPSAGIFGVNFATFEDRLVESIRGSAEILSGPKTFPTSRDDLRRTAKLMLAEAQVERVEEQAMHLGLSEIEVGNHETAKEEMAKVMAVSANDLKRLSTKYFRPENLSIVVLMPKEILAEKSAREWESEIQQNVREGLEGKGEGNWVNMAKDPNAEIPAELSTIPTELLASQNGRKQFGVDLITLPNGVRIVTQPDQQTGVFSIQAHSLGGLLAETKETNGLSELMARTWLSQARLKDGTIGDRSIISRRMSEMGGDIFSTSGFDSVGFTINAFSYYSRQAIDLFLDVLRHPTLSSQKVDFYRRQILEDLEALPDDPFSFTFQAMLKRMYNGHPYGMNPLGTPESLMAIKPEDVVNFHRRIVHPEKLVISVAGNFDRSQVLDQLAERLGGWTAPSLDLPPISKATFSLQPQVETIQLDRGGTFFAYGIPGATVTDRGNLSLDVLNNVLSSEEGTGGRLFYQMRDILGLGYSFFTSMRHGRTPGYLAVLGAVEPEVGQEAVEAIENLMKEVATQRIPQEEIDEARNHLLGYDLIAKQGSQERASELGLDVLYGLGPNAQAERLDAIRNLTQEDIQEAQERFLGQPSTVVVMEPPV